MLARYDGDGDLIWARREGDQGQYDVLHDLAVPVEGFTVATGHFSETVAFGEGEENETILEAEGASDIYVAKFSIDDQ